MKKFIVLITFALISFTNKDSITIFLAGDSTMADKPIEDNPERGWGQVFSRFFNDQVKIENHARNGRSTKSFIDQGRWDSLINRVSKGDYVFIQFGHNDSKKDDPNRYAEAHTDYKNNLIRFVNDCKNKGATPVLLTPVVRRRFDENGNFFDIHGDYPEVVREVAREQNVFLIDLNQKSAKLVSGLGVERSKELYLHIEPGKYKLLPDGKKDDTHFSKYGAMRMAQLVVDGIKELNIDLKNYLQEKNE